MVSNGVLIAIVVGIFFVGIGTSYIYFANTYDPIIMNQKQMMNDPQQMNQWMNAMMNNPQMMSVMNGNMMGSGMMMDSEMMGNVAKHQSMHDSMMAGISDPMMRQQMIDDPDLKQQLLEKIEKHIQSSNP